MKELYFDQAEIRRDALLREAQAARLAKAAQAGRPSLLRRIWQFVRPQSRTAQAKKPSVRRSRRVTRVEKRAGAMPVLHVRAHERAESAQAS